MFKGTTIIGLKHNGATVIAGDGQVSLGNTVLKHKAVKVRKLKYNIITGFAGATADAFTLFERLEQKLDQFSGHLLKSCVALAKDWRTDKFLRKLEAMMIVANKENLLVLTGTGDVLEPDENVIAIGSGGNYALSAAKAYLSLKDIPLSAKEIAEKSLKIAAELCIYTNSCITIEEV